MKKQVLVRRQAKALMLDPIGGGEVTYKDVKAKLRAVNGDKKKSHKKQARGKAREWREPMGEA